MEVDALVTTRLTCPACGLENEADARFCRSCGTTIVPLSAVDAEVRKVVTVLFSDVVESTRMGHKLDPESLRRLMTRYFDEMRSVLEYHGGVVEKFIGDAVMAVFGVPRAHEDDAMRAVRAAVDMRAALAALNDEFERTWRVTVNARTGVNTGEVIAGDPSRGQSFVLGDAVNVAARLEQAALPGEIFIGEVTYRLVREAVQADAVEPLTVKGKPEPLSAWRLRSVQPGTSRWARRLDSPLVGREGELSELERSFERVATRQAPELVLVMGGAGVGKSRLSQEFLTRIAGRATVVSGGCLPYGEGLTFWPIAAVIREAAGIDDTDSPEEARGKIEALVLRGGEDAVVGDRLAALLGLAPATPGIRETFWAVRKLLEQLSSRRPLVVVFDDIHWGEPTFLDLVEYLADWLSSVPTLLLCLTRPELLETRPEWATGRPNASVIRLEPLTDKQTHTLIENLTGRVGLAGTAAERIAEVAEGNPLFVEETLRMLADEGLLKRNGQWTVGGDLSAMTIPPTIHALITARLDRLEPAERAVIGRASVVGRVFWSSAVTALCPSELRPSVMTHLQSLTYKELIRPDSSERQEDAFRFAHILVRDAAYQTIPKSVRADLHERLVDWLEVEIRDRAGEYEEILGYHLEQAYRALLELGPMTEEIESLGRRGAGALAAAGRRALARGDMPAAVRLLSRATELLPEKDPKRLELLPQLAFSLMEIGDFERLQEVAAETEELASESGDVGFKAHSLVLRLSIQVLTNPEGWAEVAEREAPRAIATFEAVGDERGMAKAWSLLALVHLMSAQFGPGEEAWAEAAAHARKAGDRRDELESLAWVPLFVWAGPTPSADGLRRCREILERVQGDRKAMSSALIAQAAFESGLGRFEDARLLIAQAKALLQEVALAVWLAGPFAQFAGWVELLAGDPAAAERELRPGFERLEEIGELAWLSTVAAILAEAVYEQGRFAEAEQLTQRSEQAAGAEDAYSQALLRSVRAKVQAQGGRTEDAERLARDAVRFAETTDFLHLRWHALMSLAEVLRLADRADDARPVLTEAIRLAEQKGSPVAAEQARALLAMV
jgi:class 3 adenylate cyclase/tetratricopeptide (TPR) repeat protein